MDIKYIKQDAKNYYIQDFYDDIEYEEDFEKINLIRRFLIKLHKNKDVNITLLSNHCKILYNVFDNEYITNVLYDVIEPELRPYIKTMLIFLNKIDINNKLFRDVEISYDFDYLLNYIDKK